VKPTIPALTASGLPPVRQKFAQGSNEVRLTVGASYNNLFRHLQTTSPF